MEMLPSTTVKSTIGLNEHTLILYLIYISLQFNICTHALSNTNADVDDDDDDDERKTKARFGGLRSNTQNSPIYYYIYTL